MAQFTPYKGEKLTQEEAAKKFTPYMGEAQSTPVLEDRVTREKGILPPDTDGFMSGKMFASDFGKKPEEVQDQRAFANERRAETSLENEGVWDKAKRSAIAAYNPLQTIKTVGKGLINGVNSGIETGLAAVDSAVEAGAAATVGRNPGEHAWNPGLAEKFHNTVPYLPADDLYGQELLQKTAEVAPGMIAGDKGAGKILGPLEKTVGKTAQAGKIVARGTISNAAGAITQDENDPTLLQALSGEGPVNDPGSSYSGNVLNQKLRQMGEGVALGAGTGALSRAGVGAAKWATDLVPKALANSVSVSAHKQEFVKDLLHIYAGITPDMSKQTVQDRLKQAATVLAQHKDLVVKFGDDQIDDLTVKQDLVTAMLNTLDPKIPEQAEIANQLRGLRSSALSGGSPGLENTLRSNKTNLEETLGKVQETRGGDAGIERAKDDIVSEGQKQLEIPRQKVRDAEAGVVSARKGIDQEIAENPGFRDIVSRNPNSDGKVRVDYSTGRLDKADEIVKTLETADMADTSYKNKTYKDIPDDAEGNAVAFDEALKRADNSIDEELRKTIPPRANFKMMYDWANTTLTDKIAQLRSPNVAKFTEATRLQELKQSIVSDQLDYLTASGQKDVADTAKIARDNFKGDYAPKYRDGVLRDMQENNRYLPDGEAAKSNRDLVEKVLSDPTERINTNKVLDVLESQSGNNSGKLAGDYVLYKIADKLSKSFVKNGEMSAEDAMSLATEFDDYVPVLKRTNPDVIPQIEEFLTSVRGKTFNQEKAIATLNEMKAAGEAAEDQVFGTELRDFMKKEGKNWVSKGNGYESFKQILGSEQSDETLARLSASDNPVIKSGMEASWAKMALEQTKTQSGAIGAELPENFVRYGKTIFGEDSQIPDAIVGLRQLAEEAQNANKTRMVNGLDMRESGDKAARAVNSVAVWVFGVLNPTAAKVRTISKDLLKKGNFYDRAKGAADDILKNKEEFDRIAKIVVSKGESGLSPADKALARRILVRGATNDLSTQTERAFK